MVEQLLAALKAVEDALAGVETAAQAADHLTVDARRLLSDRAVDGNATQGKPPPDAQPSDAV
jgi:hypothetical protein